MDMLTKTLSSEGLRSEEVRRDPSFSTYLSAAEERFVRGLAKQSFSGKDGDDGEIDVFGAEKYFNESLEVKNPKLVEKVYVESPIRSENQPRALSVRSASSWNSQSALLRKQVKSPSGGGKVRGRGYLGSFRCRCVCSGKSSAAVEEYESCHSISLHQSATKDQLKSGFSPLIEKITYAPDQGPKSEANSISKDSFVEDLMPMKPRKSLKVFGSPILETRNKSFSFEKFPTPAETVIPTPAAAHGVGTESDSDASSDLFEIADFASKANPFFLPRNISCSTAPTAGYAPSEASIEWSIVTASAADFPITTDYEEFKSGTNTANCKTGSAMMNKKVTAISDKPRRLSGSFLACNGQDSVKVVNHTHRTYGQISHTKIVKSQDLAVQVLTPQTEAKLTAFDPSRNMCWNKL